MNDDECGSLANQPFDLCVYEEKASIWSQTNTALLMHGKGAYVPLHVWDKSKGVDEHDDIME